MREGCEVCGREDQEVAGVAAVPGAPVSLAWCRECLRNHAQPLFCVSVLLGDPPGWDPETMPPPTLDEQFKAMRDYGITDPEKIAAEWFLEETVYVGGEYIPIREYLRRNLETPVAD